MINLFDDNDSSVQVGYSFDSSLSGLEMDVVKNRVREEEHPITDIGVGGSVLTSPIAFNGSVYFGSCDENFYSVDAETGKKNWSFPTKGPINGSPTLDNGILYFGSYDHNLYALTLNGELLWKFPTKGNIFSRPCVYNGIVYFGSYDHNLYALNAKTGKEFWRFSTNNKISSWPVVHNNTIYFGSNDYNFYALNLNGSLKWRFQTNKEAGIFNAIIYNDIVYFGSFDRNIYAVKSDTGKLVWRFHLSEFPNTVIARKDNILIFGSRDCNFYGVSTEGKLIWRFPTDTSPGGGISIYWSTAYLNGGNNNLYALDSETGRLIWRFYAGGPVAHTNPCLYKDRLYFGSHDCNLYCITKNGSLEWKFKTSLSYVAPFFLESEQKKSAEIMLETQWDVQEMPKKAYKKEELGSYGDFKGQYIGEDMRDYIGSEVKDGVPGLKYKTGKGVYRK